MINSARFAGDMPDTCQSENFFQVLQRPQLEIVEILNYEFQFIMRPVSERLRNLLWKSVKVLPLRYRLATRIALMKANSSSFEREWHMLACLGPCRGTALDIGANRGFYSCELAKLYERVISFEPNQSITNELIALKDPRIELRHQGLSDKPGKTSMYIPRSERGRVLDGWASLDKENLGARSGIDEILIETTTLDSLDLNDVTFVKMDVEGHEVQVLTGGQSFLARNKPQILIEVRKENFESVKAILGHAGLVEQNVAGMFDTDSSEPMLLFSKQSSS